MKTYKEMTLKDHLAIYDERIKTLEEAKKAVILNDNLSILIKHSPLKNINYKDIVLYVSIARGLYLTDIIDETEKLRKTLAYYAIAQALPFHFASWINGDITFSKDIEFNELTFINYEQVRSTIKKKADLMLNELIEVAV